MLRKRNCQNLGMQLEHQHFHLQCEHQYRYGGNVYKGLCRDGGSGNWGLPSQGLEVQVLFQGKHLLKSSLRFLIGGWIAMGVTYGLTKLGKSAL